MPTSPTQTTDRLDETDRGLRATLRRRRQARATYRALEAELASYTGEAEVADLMAALEGRDDAGAEQMRTILTGNLAHRSRSAA